MGHIDLNEMSKAEASAAKETVCEQVTFLGIPVDKLTMEEALLRFRRFMNTEGMSLIVTPNSQIILETETNATLRNVLLSADMLIPDGVGLMYASKIVHSEFPERVTGIDFTYNALKVCASLKKKVFFLGGKTGVAVLAAQRLSKEIPGLVIAGNHDGYFKPEEESDIVAMINESGAEFLCIAMGCPKQEIFARSHEKEMPGIRAAIGIGGSLDVWSGNLKRAPEFYRKTGLEWLYRMLQEPWRFKRFFELPRFILRVASEKMKK